MHRALPSDTRSAAKIFDIVQYIFDNSGVAVGMSATARLDSHMENSTQMFEQTTGRVGIPIHIPRDVKWSDIDQIVKQYISKPDATTKHHAMQIANNKGHIRQLVERLKTASRIAGKAGEKLDNQHFITAIRIRAELAKNNPRIKS
jgi:DNA transposition AAA+ family ATPase